MDDHGEEKTQAWVDSGLPSSPDERTGSNERHMRTYHVPTNWKTRVVSDDTEVRVDAAQDGAQESDLAKIKDTFGCTPGSSSADGVAVKADAKSPQALEEEGKLKKAFR